MKYRFDWSMLLLAGCVGFVFGMLWVYIPLSIVNILNL